MNKIFVTYFLLFLIGQTSVAFEKTEDLIIRPTQRQISPLSSDIGILDSYVIRNFNNPDFYFYFAKKDQVNCETTDSFFKDFVNSLDVKFLDAHTRDIDFAFYGTVVSFDPVKIGSCFEFGDFAGMNYKGEVRALTQAGNKILKDYVDRINLNVFLGNKIEFVKSEVVTVIWEMVQCWTENSNSRDCQVANYRKNVESVGQIDWNEFIEIERLFYKNDKKAALLKIVETRLGPEEAKQFLKNFESMNSFHLSYDIIHHYSHTKNTYIKDTFASRLMLTKSLNYFCDDLHCKIDRFELK